MPKKPPAEKPEGLPTPPEAAPLRPLDAIVGDIAAAIGKIGAAEVQFQRETLADRVWIGVLCLAAREHHAVPVQKRSRGQNQHTKVLTSTRRSEHKEPTAVAVHPQGFLAWIGLALPGMAQPTAYKYMAAARGLGLDAWSTEQEVRKLVAQRLREFDARSQPLTLGMLATQGKEVGGEEASPKKPDLDAIKTDAVQTLFSFMDEVVNVKDALTPVERDAVVNRVAEILRRLTGQEWSPV
ncbi:MAG TPA: hypothetical protein PLA50_05095 [Bacteroidia bacterium]|nr:hypothetical protein [Bacteroidia bacterium]